MEGSYVGPAVTRRRYLSAIGPQVQELVISFYYRDVIANVRDMQGPFENNMNFSVMMFPLLDM